MTDEERLALAERRVAQLNAHLDSAPPACPDCKWCFGPDEGYYLLGEGKNCSNPVVMIDGTYDPVTGVKSKRVKIHVARAKSGPCGPRAVFYESKAGARAREIREVTRTEESEGFFAWLTRLITGERV